MADNVSLRVQNLRILDAYLDVDSSSGYHLATGAAALFG